MSGGMDGAKASVRRAAAAKPKLDCSCGRTVYSNAGIRAHQKACEVSLRQYGWPLDDAMRRAVFEEYGTKAAVAILRHVQLGLGAIYLTRRLAGHKTEMRWTDFRDTVWRLADEAATHPAS
ncbi:hypothetical protein [Mycolicibacterium alvei]|nr:hypothetical protein [Mycolicibacterium alvei]MCV7003479.1 hypothetical protein [Mycolicibacterium alvei]